MSEWLHALELQYIFSAQRYCTRCRVFSLINAEFKWYILLCLKRNKFVLLNIHYNGTQWTFLTVFFYSYQMNLIWVYMVKKAFYACLNFCLAREILTNADCYYNCYYYYCTLYCLYELHILSSCAMFCDSLVFCFSIFSYLLLWFYMLFILSGWIAIKGQV